MTDTETKLLEFQGRLEAHFRELRSSRSSDQPIFALEHCLDEREVNELFHAVREHVLASSPSVKHSLPWIVYSSELGYGFSGYEYWQTFEEVTPGWPGNEYRYWLRGRYQDFAADYGGAEPSGAWAEHFSIICWPITHAILPKDLQLHLARILWESRNSFSEETLESPQTLGELIHSRSWNASSHFRYFAKNKRLVGQVAAPLLFEGRSGTDKFIRPETLERIGKDMTAERKAREWLKAAQGEVRRRVSVKGVISSRKDPTARDIDSPQKARKEIEKLGIEPRLLLRPEDRENRQWTVRLEIPDLSHLPNRFPDILELLAESRCVVEGAGRRPIARGMFLHGPHSVRLEKWPSAQEVLLKFERENRKFNYLLQTECLLRPTFKRLFRIASDGLAYEMRNPRVRPGQSYVLLSTEGPVKTKDDACASTKILCAGVHGAILRLPDAISSDLENFLQELGIGLSGKIEVWPSGLSPVAWDGEGRAEWSPSETPCLAIRADHTVDSLTILMEGSAKQALKLAQGNMGEPVFVEFDGLPAGRHIARIFSSSASSGGKPELLGEVVMHVRPQRLEPKGPLFARTDPLSPTLEDIWEGKADVSIFGPRGRRVKSCVSMFERSKGKIVMAKQLPVLELPVSADRWRSHFEKFFRQTSEAQKNYDTARFCELEFSAEELGTFRLRCEEHLRPIKWRIAQREQKYFLRLLDDSGDDGTPEVGRAEFATPLLESALDSKDEYEVPDSGGIYIARTRIKRFETAVIVPPRQQSGLQSLGYKPHIKEQSRSEETLLEAVKTVKLWARARPAGNPLAALYRRGVVRALTHHVFRLLCGKNWATKEETFASNNDAESLKSLSKEVEKNSKTGSVLLKEVKDLAQCTCGERVSRLARLVVNIKDSERLAEFSLVLASDPGSLKLREGETLNEVLKRIFNETTLTKAARFLVLATDHQLCKQGGTTPGELYAGWRWK